MCSTDAVTHPGDRRPLDALEREITELAAHIHSATCRWLGLVAEFDRAEGWAQWGCRSCAHWVSWRCGIAPVAAREHVRVARRLEQLPLIRGAFAEGRLSFSQVRALTRVENVEREQDLLDLARHATAAQLERLVRAYRGVAAVEQAAAGGGLHRWLSWSHDDDGSLLLRARLPAEEGAVVLAALEAARDHPPPGARRPGLGASAEAPAVDRDPRAESAAAAGSASAEAPSPTAGEARADALLVMADTLLAAGPARRNGGDRYQVVVHVDAARLRDDAPAERCELADGSPLAGETARRIACDAGIVPLMHRGGRPLSVGRKTRSIPPALRRALAARDRSCRFPGCDRTRVDAHHIHHWARGGQTELANLVHLCRHHHRLVHEGGYGLDRRSGGELIFRRPDGRRIAPCPRLPASRPATVTDRGRRTSSSADACAPLSDQPLDLGLGVDAVLTFAPLGRASRAPTVPQGRRHG